MPLIILTGFPCSGLTHRAQQLASALESTQSTLFKSGTIPASKPRYKINVVSTHDASHPRTVYDHARTEKEARGVAYTRAKRLLGKDSFVILDGMNYIKGYRYQLWCEAKALGTTCCVVHVGTPVDQCVANNEARIRRQEAQTQTQSESESKTDTNETESANPESTTTTTTDPTEPYPPELLNNLIFRYEEPSTHSRWDKPLFTVPWDDAEPPIADIWSALTGIPHPSATEAPTEPSALASTFASTHISSGASVAGSLATTTTRAGGLGRPRVKVRPHQATVQPVSMDSSALYDMEKRTSAIVSAIRSFTLSTPSAEAALAQGDNARGISIAVPEASTPVFIPAHVATTGTTDELAGAGGILALPRLQRLRRQWISLNRAYIAGGHAANTAMSGGLVSGQVGDAFVRFLNAEFGVGEE
ncbi:putative RNA polymerase II Elongator complex associated protein Kti12 [Aspergillus steynii IBT 23096]|uniref:Putative RNA polymerase II Elongator complex associated protein Kti12 n=1 Tax=Aspergillus steynii IBT 23096 TaxID=1392250 RepID=A0A2I2GKK3_9EURO|nr:putative RNA polymerase II Elongator complex associated protein Kti12 [Aspergillus steynii IBT 23096]PLB53408.1 putative RNA polymerase II Elongator complex associated protein Kti12 [Aspergillus steynii IBT 23096]